MEYNKFRKAFLATFALITPSVAYAKLQSRKQQPDELVHHYHIELVQLMTLAEAEMSESSKVQWFTAGLLPKIQVFVLEHECATIVECLKHAKTQERITLSYIHNLRTKLGQPLPTTTPVMTTNPVMVPQNLQLPLLIEKERQIETMNKELAQLRAQLSEMMTSGKQSGNAASSSYRSSSTSNANTNQNNKLSSGAWCTYHKRSGHYTSECRQKKRSETNRQRRTNAVCYNCQQSGHYSRECPNKRKKNQTTQNPYMLQSAVVPGSSYPVQQFSNTGYPLLQVPLPPNQIQQAPYNLQTSTVPTQYQVRSAPTVHATLPNVNWIAQQLAEQQKSNTLAVQQQQQQRQLQQQQRQINELLTHSLTGTSASSTTIPSSSLFGAPPTDKNFLG